MKQRMHPLILALFLVIGVIGSGPSVAFTLEEFQFETEAEFHAFRGLIEKLRCLVCQNESLASSQAGVAQDLREEVYRMKQEGMSEREIVTFLVDRYGDFVLYEPPLKASTLILWFGPFIFLGFAGYILFRTLGRKTEQPEEDLSEAERARLQRLLAAGGTTDNQDK
ncbi:cytochrome C biogenesis protein [Thiocapsa imhoffii]|uniref:Cytochrome c-type biogenesis protein n=1 Tax=Thiocapsa imhoffii TaxID=382777 RepID=A0A9X0WK36_9GAMM|nr:cytochrome c-type biogenesis protein [Thiocapsa imhoffii]MBK1645622.1 cytochrome C biogenesis protein [Thiocapsa imhoffii]